MDQKVSLKTQNCTIESVIQQIEKQTDYLFVYDKNDVDVKRTVYVNGSNTDVIELLKGIFANTDIDCKVLGNNITLSKISTEAPITGSPVESITLPLAVFFSCLVC